MTAQPRSIRVDVLDLVVCVYHWHNQDAIILRITASTAERHTLLPKTKGWQKVYPILWYQ